MTSSRNGSDESLVKAFAERRQNLRAIARRAGGQDEEDIVQDAFLKLVELSRREDVRKPDNLLSRVVRCLAVDRIRRRATRNALVWTDMGEGALDPAPDAERILMSAQRLTSVMAAIEAMPPRRREVFLLHRVEEFTYLQIAQRLAVSCKAVEKHMRLAIRQLSEVDD